MEKYLECHGTRMYLEEMTPEIEFLFEIFGDDFRTKNWILGHIDYIIKRMIDTLPEKDKNIIKAMYGLPKEKVSTDLDIDDKLPIDLDFSDEDVAKTFRGLRHPRRSKIVKGFREHYNNANSLKFVYEEICGEIKYLLEYGYLSSETVYLKTIMDRYKLSIEIEKHESNDDCDIEDLDLSIRAYNCLKQAEINKISDLKGKTEEDLMRVRNLGRKGTEEVIEKMQEFESEMEEEIISVIFSCDGEKTVYNYLGYTQEKIIKSIFWNIMNICNNKEVLIKSCWFSPRLCRFLLLKGYLYVEDVLEDINRLTVMLLEEDECRYELSVCREITYCGDTNVHVYRINDAVKNKIEKYSEIPTVVDFINDSKGEDVESDIVEFAERLKEDFAERLNDDEDDIDDIDFGEDDEI